VADVLAVVVQVRHVDAGSCNGCEVEISSAFGPVYDAERYGARWWPRRGNADALLVTGPVTRTWLSRLRRTFGSGPGPKVVVAVGDCARTVGCSPAAYGVAGAVAMCFGGCGGRGLSAATGGDRGGRARVDRR